MKATAEIYLATNPSFRVEPDTERKFCNFFVLEVASVDEDTPTHVADMVFHITNAPEEVLTEEQANLAREYRKPSTDVRPRSVSVGDSVIVTVNGRVTELVCAPSGWQIIAQVAA